MHGSKEAMETFVASQNDGKLGLHRRYTVRWLTRSPPLRPPRFTREANTPCDQFCGMASTCFPCLRPNNVLETELWCCGCHLLADRYYMTRQLDSDVELLVAGFNPMITLEGFEQQARSKPEFLQHVRECIGVSRLLKRLEQGCRPGKTRELRYYANYHEGRDKKSYCGVSVSELPFHPGI